MKSEQELRAAERKVSTSSAPSKTKRVTEPLFRSIGKERKLLPTQAECEYESENDSVESKVDPRTYVHTLRSSMGNETNATSKNTSIAPTVGNL